MSSIKKISKILSKMNNKEEIHTFLNEILTNSELEALEKRWRILEMLNSNSTQRAVANELNVSLCKVTRGAKILKSETSQVKKYLKKES